MSLRASFRNHEANSWTILFLTQRLCQSQYWDGPLLPILQPSSCHKSQRCASPCCCTPINLFRGIIYDQKHALSMLVAAIFSPYDELFNINWFFKMKTYMPLNGLRWSRNSGSANCDMPRSAVFGRSGGDYSLTTFSSNVMSSQCRYIIWYTGAITLYTIPLLHVIAIYWLPWQLYSITMILR